MLCQATGNPSSHNPPFVGGRGGCDWEGLGVKSSLFLRGEGGVNEARAKPCCDRPLPRCCRGSHPPGCGRIPGRGRRKRKALALQQPPMKSHSPLPAALPAAAAPLSPRSARGQTPQRAEPLPRPGIAPAAPGPAPPPALPPPGPRSVGRGAAHRHLEGQEAARRGRAGRERGEPGRKAGTELPPPPTLQEMRQRQRRCEEGKREPRTAPEAAHREGIPGGSAVPGTARTGNGHGEALLYQGTAGSGTGPGRQRSCRGRGAGMLRSQLVFLPCVSCPAQPAARGTWCKEAQEGSKRAVFRGIQYFKVHVPIAVKSLPPLTPSVAEIVPWYLTPSMTQRDKRGRFGR